MNKKLLLMLPILLVLFWESSLLNAETELKELVADIKIPLLTSRILSPEELQNLNAQLDEFMKKTDDLSLLKEIAYLVTNKVVRDRANLQFITMDLEKLAEDTYSAELAGIKPDEFKDCTLLVKKLFQTMRKNKPHFNKPDEPLNARDYKKIIKINRRFLFVSKPSIHQVWQSLGEKLKETYPIWLKRYQNLLKRLQGTSKEPEDIYNNPELKFLKVFGRVRIYWDKIS